jgi:hypothetical protein
MARAIEKNRSGRPLVKKAVAGIVLVAVVALAISLVIHVLITIVWIVAIVAVIGAVLWALNTIL